MRIHNFSTILYLPFLAITGLLGYYSMYVDRSYSIWVLAPVIFIAIIYVLKDDIDNWWFQKNPPQLPNKMKEWLIQYSPFYNELNAERKKSFEISMSTFLEVNQFYIVGKEAESMPYDIKGIVSHEAIKIMSFLENHPFKNINRIVLYKHPFPSPKHQYLHTVEADQEDGVIIFSMEHLVPGLLSPHQFYNIAGHGYLEIAKNKSIRKYIESEANLSWSDVTDVSGLEETFIKSTVGLKEVNLSTVILNTYLTYTDRFKEIFPEETLKIEMFFNTTN